MSTINSITATQSSILAATGKSTTQQIAATSSQPKANASSSVTISSSALYAIYEQTIAEKTVGQGVLLRNAFSDPNWGAGAAYAMSHENLLGGSVGGGVSLAGKTPNDPISYSNGEPVTVASQAYYTKQASSYMSQVLGLYNTELAKGTTPGQIISDIFDLQAKQPDAFRAMMSWPPLAGPSSIQTASNPSGAPEQYLNSGGQVVNSAA